MPWKHAPLAPLVAMHSHLIGPVAVDRPLVDVFPAPSATHHLPPSGVEVPGAKATNKFWANWAVEA